MEQDEQIARTGRGLPRGLPDAAPSAWGLAARRRSLGMTQAEVAAACFVSTTTLSRWESGRRRPPPSMRPALARALGVPGEEADVLTDSWASEYCGRLPGLRTAVSAVGATSKALATATGRDVLDVEAWLAGRRSVPRDFLEAASACLGLDLDDALPTLRIAPLRDAGRRESPLAVLRVASGRRQCDLARDIGVSRQTVRRWELREDGPPPARITPLARSLGCDPAVLTAAYGHRRRVVAVEGAKLRALLENLRLDSGLSRAQAARCLGVHRRTVERWEQGLSLPRERDMRTIARLYGLRPALSAALGSAWTDAVAARTPRRGDPSTPSCDPNPLTRATA